MNLLAALGISIGVLIAIWTYVAVGVSGLGLNVWAGIIAWGAYYAAGGGPTGLQKTIASHVSGNIYAFLALLIFGATGGASVPILAILVGVIAFLMCVQAKVALLSFIPGAFMGAATWVGATVGAGGDGGVITQATLMITISMILGALLGYISEVVGKKLARPAAPAV